MLLPPSHPFLWPPHSSQKEGEGGEEEVVEEVMCLRPSGYDLELYTPELLYHLRPLEAPVSPRKCILKIKGRKKSFLFFLDWAAKTKMDIITILAA